MKIEENLVNAKKIEKDTRSWHRLQVLDSTEVLVGQKRRKKYKISQEDIDSFTL